jgi:hypothetical protein
MGKGDKQHGNREAKKPKAAKKPPAPPSSLLNPRSVPGKLPAKSK